MRRVAVSAVALYLGGASAVRLSVAPGGDGVEHSSKLLNELSTINERLIKQAVEAKAGHPHSEEEEGGRAAGREASKTPDSPETPAGAGLERLCEERSSLLRQVVHGDFGFDRHHRALAAAVVRYNGGHEHGGHEHGGPGEHEHVHHLHEVGYDNQVYAAKSDVDPSEQHPLAVAMEAVHSLAFARHAHDLELPETCGVGEHFFSGNADITVDQGHGPHHQPVTMEGDRTWLGALGEASRLVVDTIAFQLGYGESGGEARRRLSNPGIVMRKPWKCKAGTNPCGPSRAGWGRNRWWVDPRAYNDDGLPVAQERMGSVDGKWDGWITPARRRRLAGAEQLPFADFQTTDLFDEVVVNAAQPAGKSVRITLGEGRELEAVTWGSRAVLQRSTKDAPVMGFEYDGLFVLSDASILCAQSDEGGDEVVCAGAGAMSPITSQYRHVHYYPTITDAWEAESLKHLESLGVISDAAELSWAMGLAVALLIAVLASATWIGRFGQKSAPAAADVDAGVAAAV
mmetsp:Transcript_29481/g.79045  ORF Transcript_29481/g.79045 Transcript_29481/m.79045 type:complete len:514 (+) Transcript_29481:81-1622(+)